MGFHKAKREPHVQNQWEGEWIVLWNFHFLSYCDFAEATTVSSFLEEETGISSYFANLFICTNLSSTSSIPSNILDLEEKTKEKLKGISQLEAKYLNVERSRGAMERI